MMKENIVDRKKYIDGAKRIVVKAGTRLLTDKTLVSPIVEQIASLKNNGANVILVSSGAVGMGMNTMNCAKRPSKLSSVQALAAIGQSKLMSLYERECARHGFHAAQLLLTAEDLKHRGRHLNIMNCISELWAQNNLPVINENDSVSVDELKLGDNDTLAALVAIMTRCDLTIILTMVDGLRSAKDGRLGERIPTVTKISPGLVQAASGTDNSEMSIGGMLTKIAAAEMVTSAGETMVIADGRIPQIITKIMNCEDTGTIFLPRSAKQMQSKKRWLNFFSRTSGKLFVDEGAEKALRLKGKSLLPSGITKIEGLFNRGDAVSICSLNNNSFAKGLSNYSSQELSAIIGKKSCEIRKILLSGDDEAIHRNNLVISS
ncbi:MAG: glutamate 5-kinase [Victivallales bacterium]|nr:glutamate 5-kinase [Victivallales bacterium]